MPSLVAGFAGALVAGLCEGFLHTDTWLAALAAAGFLSIYAVPIGFAGALIARGVWRAWQFDRLIAAARVDSGGAPGLAAWLAYLVIAGWLLAAACFNTVFLLSYKTAARPVVALSSTIVVVVFAALLVACSRPAVRALGWVFAALDRFTARRWDRSLLTPRVLTVAALVLCTGLVYLAWRVSIRPRIGHFDTSFVFYLALYIGAIAGAHALWRALDRRRLAVVAIAALTCTAGIASLATAYYVRHYKPYTMLEIWGDAELAGGAVDMTYNIQLLRRDLDLGEVGPDERPGVPHRNVVLITIDTVRADFTPPYKGKAAMPTLQQLARKGAVFEWAFSPGNVTRRSLPTIATGVSPNRVRGRVAGWALRLDPRHVLLAERFRAAGYDTAGFLCCGSQFAPRHRLGLIRGIDHLVINKDGVKLSLAASQWLTERAASNPDKPLFMWMHLIEPHLWDERYPAREHGSDKRRRYKMSLEQSDRILAMVLRGFGEEALAEDTYLFVTSDHGEGLGDRGTKFHSTNLYNSQTHVPLVVVGPGIAVTRIPQPMGLVDLAPTMLDLAGFVPPGMPQMDGVNLGPILRGEQKAVVENGEAYSAMVKDRSVKHSLRSLVVGNYKLIETDSEDKVELYDLHHDRRERRDLTERKPDVLKRMRARMAERRAMDAISPF